MNSKFWFGLGLGACIGLFAIALYMQYMLGLMPCPLCIVQRILVIAMGAVFLIGLLFGSSYVWRKLWAVILILFGFGGMAVAGWHVYLQNLPPEEVPECGPGLDFMWENFPLGQMIDMVFKGSGECAEISWQFLGLTIPGWTIVAFAGLTILAIKIFMLRPRDVR
ncbi:MAG: disulfide bond formation protein B [Arenicellales bacterium WSBS_2016_MAG_OTU3]